MPTDAEDFDELEVRLLLEAIRERFGYDFRQYSRAALRRRLSQVCQRTGDDSLSQLQHRLLHQRGFFEEMLVDMTVTTSDMFRDPPFFRALREKVCPLLKTFPFINVWHAGCSTGQEVYSTAIVLKEEGLLPRCTIYATDLNKQALRQAREGIYSLAAMRGFTSSYQKAGGTRPFGEYYHAAYGAAQMTKELRSGIVFCEHNLVSDSVFCEAHLVLSRNVLIYFERELQDRVLQLFADSLQRGGFLCLGSKENLRFSEVVSEFDEFEADHRIYRKRPTRGRVPDWKGRILASSD